MLAQPRAGHPPGPGAPRRPRARAPSGAIVRRPSRSEVVRIGRDEPGRRRAPARDAWPSRPSRRGPGTAPDPIVPHPGRHARRSPDRIDRRHLLRAEELTGRAPAHHLPRAGPPDGPFGMPRRLRGAGTNPIVRPRAALAIAPRGPLAAEDARARASRPRRRGGVTVPAPIGLLHRSREAALAAGRPARRPPGRCRARRRGPTGQSASNARHASVRGRPRTSVSCWPGRSSEAPIRSRHGTLRARSTDRIGTPSASCSSRSELTPRAHSQG